MRLAEQEINKSFMGMGKRGEQMIKPKIIFCINQAAGREKRDRIDLKLQEGVFVLTSSGKEMVPVNGKVNSSFILTVYFEDCSSEV